MQMNSLQDLYIHELRDLYSAEQQLLKAMPRMIEQASNTELRQGLESHLRQTHMHAQRLERLLEGMSERPGGEKCKGMQGIVDEGGSVVKDVRDAAARDAAIIASAQSVEHYEIAGYGTARTWARQLGREQDARVLQQTLQEEEQTDRLLTQIAESMVNPQAQRGEREVARGAKADTRARTDAPASSAAERSRGRTPEGDWRL